MPAWIVPILVKIVLPFVVQELVKSGVLSEIQAAAVKDVASLITVLKNLKTYSSPSDFPEQVHKNGV